MKLKVITDVTKETFEKQVADFVEEVQVVWDNVTFKTDYSTASSLIYYTAFVIY
jgi:hypothetical protein